MLNYSKKRSRQKRDQSNLEIHKYLMYSETDKYGLLSLYRPGENPLEFYV